MKLPSRDRFYAQRDSRTNSTTDALAYQTASFLVVGESEVLETYTGRVLVRTVTNILSRFARDVDLAFPSVAPDTELPSRGHTLAEQCLYQMWAADPHGHFGWVGTASKREYDCAIVVGDPDMNIASKATIYVDGSGWIARVARDESVASTHEHDSNPVGPMTAACLAAAEGFKTANSVPERQLSQDITYDAFQHKIVNGIASNKHPSLPSSIDFGTVQLVGVGSVGSAAVRFLHRLPVTGTIQLVDHDKVELVNLNRSPLFMADHALNGMTKVEVAKEFLDRADLEVSAHDISYKEFESQDTGQPDVLLPLANEQSVRSDIQHNRPPLMLHATTSGADVTVRRNIPFDEACLLCHFPPDSPEIDAPCASGPVSTDKEESSEDNADAALPFASFLAGCFVAAELAKLPLDTYPTTENIARVQTLVDIGARGILQYPKNRADDCTFCTSASQDVHLKRISGTRFDYFTT
jgi:hypothetical protein